MLFKKKDLTEKLGLSKEGAELVLEFQKKMPILTENGDGFCVDARKLHEQLGVGRDYTTWIKGRITKYKFLENQDYILTLTKTGERQNVIQHDYILTIGMAKELSMVENNDNGFIARKYFILMEKSLKNIIEWNRIREPEKEQYKELCDELDKFLLRNFNKNAKFYDYINEANAINLICLGARAKDIREYFDAQDKNTRDHLLKEYNIYLSKMQELDIMYLRMNMQKMQRYDLIKQGFKALYPNASFVIANKDKKAV